MTDSTSQIKELQKILQRHLTEKKLLIKYFVTAIQPSDLIKK